MEDPPSSLPLGVVMQHAGTNKSADYIHWWSSTASSSDLCGTLRIPCSHSSSIGRTYLLVVQRTSPVWLEMESHERHKSVVTLPYPRIPQQDSLLTFESIEYLYMFLVTHSLSTPACNLPCTNTSCARPNYHGIQIAHAATKTVCH